MLREYDPYEEPGILQSSVDWLLEYEYRMDMLTAWVVTIATWAMTLAVLLSGAWLAL